MNYTIVIKNIGYTQATNLRLTMAYPDATILHNAIRYNNENVTSENSTESVAVFSPRLAAGAKISVDTSITRPANSLTYHSFNSLIDYTQNSDKYPYYHSEAYSVTATYDQGSREYTPPPFLYSYPYLNIGISQSTIVLIILAFLSLAIPFRYKKRSKSKFVSHILKDIRNVSIELKQDSPNGHPYGNLIPLHTLDSIFHLQ